VKEGVKQPVERTVKAGEDSMADTLIKMETLLAQEDQERNRKHRHPVRDTRHVAPLPSTSYSWHGDKHLAGSRQLRQQHPTDRERALMRASQPHDRSARQNRDRYSGESRDFEGSAELSPEQERRVSLVSAKKQDANEVASSKQGIRKGTTNKRDLSRNDTTNMGRSDDAHEMNGSMGASAGSGISIYDSHVDYSVFDNRGSRNHQKPDEGPRKRGPDDRRFLESRGIKSAGSEYLSASDTQGSIVVDGEAGDVIRGLHRASAQGLQIKGLNRASAQGLHSSAGVTTDTHGPLVDTTISETGQQLDKRRPMSRDGESSRTVISLHCQLVRNLCTMQTSDPSPPNRSTKSKSTFTESCHNTVFYRCAPGFAQASGTRCRFKSTPLC
jgi:hypothetical protein